jgi:predicted nucleotidyltransferase component of viral defense system
MTESEYPPRRLYEDAPFFREALAFTVAETGFAARLIEKDYFCTLLLEHLTKAESPLVFKGGTCLAKVHAGFYRLSEDLDFVVPTAIDASRAERRRSAAGPKAAVASVGEHSGLRLIAGLRGANDSSQYAGVIGYTSLLGPQAETVKIEVGLREPLLTAAEHGQAETLLLDPVSGSALVAPLPVPCLSRQEAMAEKLRAALSRRQVAIRDFYDVDYAVCRLGLRVDDPSLVRLVRAKLEVPGNDPVDVSSARFDALQSQLASYLRPVLRDRDFVEFDLERAVRSVTEVAAAVANQA